MDPSNRYISVQDRYGLYNMSYTKYLTDNWTVKAFCTNCTDVLTKLKLLHLQFHMVVVVEITMQMEDELD